MAELAGNNSDRRQIEFEALKLAAEAQMRRCAPPLDSRAAKRLRLDSSDEATHEAKRYSYAAYGVVIKGCTCFVATSDFRRERSSTKEVIELLQQVIPGVQLQLVKVGCNGVIMVAALSQPGQPAVRPTDVVKTILQQMASGDLQRTKFCQRITPAETTCLSTPAALKDALAKVVSSYVAHHCSIRDWVGPLQFAVMFRNRGDSAAANSKSQQQQQKQQQQQPEQQQHSQPTNNVSQQQNGQQKQQLQPQQQNSQNHDEVAANANASPGQQQQQQQAESFVEQQEHHSTKAEQHNQAQPHRQPQADDAAATPCSAAAAHMMLDRAIAIQVAAEVVSECCKDQGGSKTNLTDPQAVVLLEVVPMGRRQAVCAVAMVPSSMVVMKPRIVMKPTSSSN